MSSVKDIFSKPKKPKLPATPEPVEEIATIEEDATEAKRRERKRLITGGRRSTILSGIAASLKKRLGA